MELTRRVVDQPRGGQLVTFSPTVKGDAERCVEYYQDKPEVLQRLAAKGYLKLELDTEDEPIEEPKAPPRGKSQVAQAPEEAVEAPATEAPAKTGAKKPAAKTAASKKTRTASARTKATASK